MLGLLLHAIVHLADIQNRDGGILLLATSFVMYPFLQILFADASYQGRQSTTRSTPANADRQALGSGQGIRGPARALDR
jgi:hypothetical protein